MTSIITIATSGWNSKTHSEKDGLPHVLLVIDQFPKTLGGGERILLRLAALLPEYGFRVSILTFYIHPETSCLKSSPCPIYLLPLTKTYNFTAFRAAVELRRFLIRQKVLIVQTFFESSDLWAGLVAKLTPNVRLIWSRRDMGILRSRKHGVAYRLISSAPDAVLAVSEQVRQHCIEVDRVSPARVETVYNGIDMSEWNGDVKSGESSRNILVTTVGNIRRVKGHDVFIRAAAYLREHFRNVTFSIAGDVLEPQYFEELQALVRNHGLSEQFSFAGGVTDLQMHLRAADIFVLPSRSEGFSNAIVEAMAASLPVVATDVGGNPEAVQTGVTGYIVPPENAEALAMEIGRLLSDPELRRRMGSEGKRLVEEKFTTAAMMSKVTAVYKALLN